MWPREEAPHFSSRLPCLQHLTLLTSSSYSSPSEALQAASNASPSPPPTATSPTAHLWAQWRLSNITEWLTEHFLFPSVLLLLLLLPFPSRTSSFQAWPVSLSLCSPSMSGPSVLGASAAMCTLTSPISILPSVLLSPYHQGPFLGVLRPGQFKDSMVKKELLSFSLRLLYLLHSSGCDKIL